MSRLGTGYGSVALAGQISQVDEFAVARRWGARSFYASALYATMVISYDQYLSNYWRDNPVREIEFAERDFNIYARPLTLFVSCAFHLLTHFTVHF